MVRYVLPEISLKIEDMLIFCDDLAWNSMSLDYYCYSLQLLLNKCLKLILSTQMELEKWVDKYCATVSKPKFKLNFMYCMADNNNLRVEINFLWALGHWLNFLFRGF